MKKLSSRGCLLYGAGFFFGIPLLLALIGFLVISGRERSAKQRLSDRLAKIVAQGLPVDDASMLDYTNSLTSKEDTKEWLAVLGELTSDEFSKSTTGVPTFDVAATEELIVPEPGQPWAQEQVTRDFLARWGELRNRVSRLSLKQLEPGTKPVRFITEFNSVSTLLPQTQNMRQAARMLALNGQVAVFDRNSAKARLSIEALLGCSRTVAGEPTLVSQLVVVSIEGMAIGILRSALEADVLNEKDLLVLLPRIMEQINISPQWKIAMQGERAMLLPAFKHPELIFRSTPGMNWLPGRSADALHYLDFMDQVLSVPDSDFDQFRVAINKIEQDLQRNLEGNLIQRYDSLLTTLITPAVSAAASAYVRDATQNRMAVIAMAIRLYEKRNGSMPATLDDLQSLELGELKLDPAALLPPGGAPFGYRLEDTRVLLWGFDLNQTSSTPADPPSVEEGSMNAAMNRLWLWTFEKKKAE